MRARVGSNQNESGTQASSQQPEKPISQSEAVREALAQMIEINRNRKER